MAKMAEESKEPQAFGETLSRSLHDANELLKTALRASGQPEGNPLKLSEQPSSWLQDLKSHFSTGAEDVSSSFGAHLVTLVKSVCDVLAKGKVESDFTAAHKAAEEEVLRLQ